MSNNKQSSVEWYSNQIGKITADALSGKITGLQWSYLELKTRIQAKAMHKEEIINATIYGDRFEGCYGLDSEQYYNETYGGNHEQQ